ncbi:MAG: SUMF1/EgtB/PvdO family nonheme iron enzyme [Planctomycetes bacterium]|nr:SUMF1/EgtB/PvdO family nonheme iron enzyme [Planctomycetota bacterium]MBL7039559.1 SUMF1/EgtB/PvdO family nonheme iron enzyme [Pirellulaceae bacterium]
MGLGIRRVATVTLVPILLGLVVAGISASYTQAAEPGFAFLAPEASVDKLGAEAKAAWQLAEQLTEATLVLPAEDGEFVNQQGQPVTLEQFQAVWHHQGDTVAQNGPICRPKAVGALRKYVDEGGGLFLSGAALAMIHTMGIEPVRPRIGAGGSDGYQAKLIAECRDHPVFAGLAFEGIFEGNTLIPLTNGGWPAYSDFMGSGGPARGMLLARANAGSENPLAEYEFGKGRVIVLGWRAPNYALANNAHRDNLERLTGNILTYLADKETWQEIVLGSVSIASKAAPGVSANGWRALDMAIRDLIQTFETRYPDGPQYLDRLATLKKAHEAVLGEDPAEGESADKRTFDGDQLKQLDQIAQQFEGLKQEALLANPLVDFDRLMLVRRGVGNLGLPANWQSNSSLPTTGFDNQIAVLSPVRPDGELTTFFEPDGGRFVGDVDLHFDADRMLFSMPGSNGRWQVFEMGADGSGLHELPLIHEPDVDNYDACYLSDGRILFTSTAPFVGVPCVYGGSHVTNAYLLDHDGSIRQLTVDQEHNWCPTVLNNGRILYLRWEYSDLPHSNSRILFHMNPDGTGQMEYYGSNSFFVNSFFYARPVPDHPTKVVGIATGHHGMARSGRMLILDPALGRHEADGVVQEVPGWGKKVEPIIKDNLADGIWPQFLHPYPLSEKHFLVTAKPTPQSFWGIYLVDVFDNMLLLCEEPGYAMFEPVPLRKTPKPPVIADKVDLKRKDALVYLNDIYLGGGLKGIPRGTVKQLRLVTYHFSYRGMGGLLGAVGMDGPWDVKRVLGTVPVEPDGSALFRVPAYTPVAVQPLDENGQSLQLMRSWFTAMPGEVLSCVGCHEQQNTVTVNRETIAARRKPSEIATWRGPVRGFSFQREVQPVLDKHCVGCHGGQPLDDGRQLADLRGTKIITDWDSKIAGHVNVNVGGKFSDSYVELHRFVRRPGIESNIRLLAPMEFHADATELIQMLRKGHHGVELDTEAWDRLVTWIDLNAPYHGTWTEIVGEAAVRNVSQRARAMRERFTGMTENPEEIPQVPAADIKPVVPEFTSELTQQPIDCPGWPFSSDEAQRRQADGGDWQKTVDLGEGLKLELVRIPAGQFVMGDAGGHPDEWPRTVVKIEKPFWMSRFEITNEQFHSFDPKHDSDVEPMHGYQFGIHGYPVNQPRQPAVRISWSKATAFCRWLSGQMGRECNLPTEAQWEYACRAGTDTPFWYGGPDTDFTKLANLGDIKLREFALDTYVHVRLVADPNKYDDWVPKDERFNDGGFVSTDAGRYEANPWGLHDMHGNVWEWTRTAFRPYPYTENDGRNDPRASGRRVVRGGSWYDRPKRCRSAFRLSYEPYHPAFNVGFRVVMEDD